MAANSTYFLVNSSILPEVFSKVIEVKKILSKDTTKPINEAVKEVGLSRSAYYKYRDYVFPFYETSRGKIITLHFVAEDLPGILSIILNKIAQSKANIVTINQNIPINGLADIIISVETAGMSSSIKELLDEISGVEGIHKQAILARE
jgi:chorismate mutase